MNLLYLLILPSIIAIALIDYALFRRILKCEQCNIEVHWTQFILPTFLEILLFIFGIIVGKNI